MSSGNCSQDYLPYCRTVTIPAKVLVTGDQDLLDINNIGPRMSRKPRPTRDYLNRNLDHYSARGCQ